VGLPTAESSWCFKTFTVEEYETVKNAIKEGTVVVNNNTEAEPEVSEFTAVNYIA